MDSDDTGSVNFSELVGDFTFVFSCITWVCGFDDECGLVVPVEHVVLAALIEFMAIFVPTDGHRAAISFINYI